MESVQIPNFLSEDRVDVVSKFYFEVCEILGCKVHEITFNNITSKVDYVSGTNYEDFDYRYCPSIEKQYSDDKVINYKKIPEDKIKDINTDWIPEMIDHLNEEFQKINRKGKICTFVIFNLPNPVQIHTDGNDIKNKRGKRNVFNPVFKREEYFPSYKKYTHQGLITIQNDDLRNGTIVFNQTFPYSVYYANHENNLDRKKSVITFLKDDDIFRFDEKIENYTYEYMSDEEYKLLPDMNREQLFGLSLDKKLMFMDKGTLVSWQDGKFHTTIPMKKEWGNRIMLQYEGVDE
ncbi:MAG: hypothetical protein CBC22_00035 [Alphaproteobacteria bacterium TMED62]|nr:MAG: hypothetical protein CBC22_00035 [Alphaproteobacteria bacterium TMED62]